MWDVNRFRAKLQTVISKFKKDRRPYLSNVIFSVNRILEIQKRKSISLHPELELEGG